LKEKKLIRVEFGVPRNEGEGKGGEIANSLVSYRNLGEPIGEGKKKSVGKKTMPNVCNILGVGGKTGSKKGKRKFKGRTYKDVIKKRLGHWTVRNLRGTRKGGGWERKGGGHYRRSALLTKEYDSGVSIKGNR